MTHLRFLASALSLATLLFSGCNSVDLPKGTSKGYSSAQFVSSTQRVAAEGALEDSPEVVQAVRKAIETEFNSHGIRFGNDGSELVVAYMLINQGIGSTAANDDHFGRGRDAGAILDEAHRRGVIKSKGFEGFGTGAIVIDILDAKSSELIYRNFAKRNIAPTATPQERKQRVGRAVHEALDGFFQ